MAGLLVWRLAGCAVQRDEARDNVQPAAAHRPEAQAQPGPRIVEKRAEQQTDTAAPQNDHNKKDEA